MILSYTSSVYGPGTIIGEKYRLAEQIGQGGMASIWRAVHVDLEREVGVKLLRIRGMDHEDQTQRFLAEAKVAAKIRHRNVVDIMDFGMHNEQPYMVMELLVGMDLAERITDGDPLPVPELIRLMRLALGGLGAVHDAGIIHRDLKPENIFLVKDADGIFPKLLDFGISRMASGRTLGSILPTEDGVIVGTPEYMAPEQARGLRDIDSRADIYSMAVIIYEVLTGRLPFWSENVGDLIVQITTGSAPTLAALRPDLGQPLSDVLERAMLRDPQQRFADARQFRQALADAADKTAEVSNTWARATATRFAVGSSRQWAAGDSLGPGSGSQIASASHRFASAKTPATMVPSPPVNGYKRAVSALSLAVAGLALFIFWPGASTPDLSEAAATTSTIERELEQVRVRLDGVPTGARVLLDGTPVQAMPIVIPKSGSVHDIEVIGAGLQPWRVKHRANESGAYRVITAANAPEESPSEEAERGGVSQSESAPSERTRERPRTARPRPSKRAPSSPGTSRMSGMLYRSPGF